MEFWGVELKGDKPVKVAPGMNQVVHLSQATLAELKKGCDPVMLSAKIGDQKLVIGVLTADKIPQLSFDLVFEKEFELSHNWKNGSVHLTGYKSLIPDEDEDDFPDFSDDDEAFPLEDKPSGVAALPAATKAKPAAVKKENKPEEEESDEDDSESDEEDESSEDDESDKEMVDGEDDDSEEEESDGEETPAKSAGGKKRPASDAKTPESKKAKLATSQKTDGKKGAQTATPQPAKNAGKGDKSNAKTPKSGGQVTCGSCKKSFNSQSALDSHSKAKHGK